MSAHKFDKIDQELIVEIALKILVALIAGRHGSAEKRIEDYITLSFRAAEMMVVQIRSRLDQKLDAK